MSARFFLFIVAIWVCHDPSCFASDLIYKVAPSKDHFPYPTMRPDISADEREHFDWKKYIDAATSPADKAYRAMVAPHEYGIDVPGGDSSNNGETTRFKLAAEELAKRCTKLENAYRERLRPDPANLKILELFIEQRTLAMNAEAELIGGSWEGSGAKNAWASARLGAIFNYFETLKGLTASLHFQDMNE